jgi:hypothetical protein
MTTRKKETSERVPAPIAYAFQHGKRSYLDHPGYAEVTEEAFLVYMVCGVLINDPAKARKLWQQYRGELLKKPGIKSWWAFKEYEPKRV